MAVAAPKGAGTELGLQAALQGINRTRMAGDPMIPPRMNFLTLACRDIERMAGFFLALGWPESASSEPVHRLFQLSNGMVLALYGAQHYERDYGPPAEGFRAVTLGINLASRDEVLVAYETLKGIYGVRDLDAPIDSPRGFSGFSFRDPEGNVWDVAWKRGSAVDDRGALTWDAEPTGGS